MAAIVRVWHTGLLLAAVLAGVGISVLPGLINPDGRHGTTASAPLASSSATPLAASGVPSGEQAPDCSDPSGAVIAGLQAQLAELRAIIAGLQQERRGPGADLSAPSAVALGAPEIASELRAQDQQWRDEQSYVLERDYGREALEPAWAAATVARIEAAVGQHLSPQTYIVGLDCRSASCRLELISTDGQAAAGGVTAGAMQTDLTRLVLELAPVLDTMTVTQIEDYGGGKRVVAFFSRNLQIRAGH